VAAEGDDADRDRVDLRVDRDGDVPLIGVDGRAGTADLTGRIGFGLVGEAALHELADERRDRRAVEAGLRRQHRSRLRAVVMEQREDRREVVPAQLVAADTADTRRPQLGRCRIRPDRARHLVLLG
jgi:hypothetical protein